MEPLKIPENLYKKTSNDPSNMNDTIKSDTSDKKSLARRSIIVASKSDLAKVTGSKNKKISPMRHSQTMPINQMRNTKKKKKSKVEVPLDAYGCREDAPQEEQVQAIVEFF